MQLTMEPDIYPRHTMTMSDPSQAAPPLLGSTLLASAQAHEKSRPRPASSGSATIDQNALDGGFRYGEITSIAGASGTGKSLVSFCKLQPEAVSIA